MQKIKKFQSSQSSPAAKITGKASHMGQIGQRGRVTDGNFAGQQSKTG